MFLDFEFTAFQDESEIGRQLGLVYFDSFLFNSKFHVGLIGAIHSKANSIVLVGFLVIFAFLLALFGREVEIAAEDTHFGGSERTLNYWLLWLHMNK